jgi:hypothetical protein
MVESEGNPTVTVILGSTLFPFTLYCHTLHTSPPPERAVPARHDGVRGPFLIVGFTGAENEVALLQTGGTAFRAPTVFKSHVCNLSKYYAKHHV